MKKLLLNRNRLMQLALRLCLILVSANSSWGQQTIGSFTYMDGGFEGQSTGNLTQANNGSANVWTKSAANSTSSIVANASLARSGVKYAIGNLATGGSNRGLQSPLGASVAGSHVIQFYYRNYPASTNIQAGIAAVNGTIQTSSATSTDWVKASFVVISTALVSTYSYVGRLNPTTAFSFDVDDVVVYSGTVVDETAPLVLASNPIVSSITSSQQTISWDASTDADFTGYMVVRGIADPATPPKVNGIYAVGNTVATGEQVVYIGNGTSFTDLGLATGTTYYYRIYTVDKAFNYSATALSFNSTTTAPIVAAADPTVQTSDLILGNITGSTLDISWTSGNGTNSLVLVKATSAGDTDPTDGGIYTSNLAFGSGTQIGTGNYAVYNGTGNSATITGLTRGITYFVKVYTFNVNAPGSQNYLITSPASGSILNLPYQNTFTFNSTTEGYTTSSRFTAPVQTTESSNGVLSVTPASNMNNLRGIVNLSSSFAKVDATNKYAHITLKNTSSFDKLELGVTKDGTTPTYISAAQTLKNGDTNYTTYDFDLTTWDLVNQFPTIAFSRNNTWISGTTYAIGDIVVVNQTFYKNIESTAITTSPLTNIADWTIVNGSAASGYPQTGAVGNAIAVLPVYIDGIVYDNVIPTLVSNGTGGGDWGTGATWAGGAVPTSGVDVNIVGTDAVNSTGTRNCNQLSIAVGSSLTVAGGSLTVKNSIINNGTITIENNANLVQTAEANTNSGSGTAIVKRNSASIQLFDYTLWSSPVVGQNLRTFSNSTLANRFYTYNSITNQYNAVDFSSPVNFAHATGYLIRAPNTWAAATPNTFNGVFTGVPNNGNISLSASALASDKFYAVGNPYPSTISADLFLNGNATGGTLYFWRKINNATTTPTTSYATYTLAGGVGTGTPNSGGSSSITPDGTIQVGQGFIVKTGASSTTLNFTNAMRTSNNTSPFLRTTEERSRFWLNLSSSTGAFCQTMVAYMPEATSGLDNAIDGRYFNDSPIALTSIINAEEYTIQGRAMPFATSDAVPLGFKTNAAGNYTIAIDHVDGLFSSGQAIYLKDNLLNTVNNLSAGSYSFASAIGTFNSRFEVVYQSTLAETNPTFTANSVIAFSENGEIKINSGSTIMELVRVYDLQGRLLVEKKQINASETILSTTARNQVLLLEITAANGTIVTKKIIQ